MFFQLVFLCENIKVCAFVCAWIKNRQSLFSGEEILAILSEVSLSPVAQSKDLFFRPFLMVSCDIFLEKKRKRIKDERSIIFLLETFRYYQKK